jgi:putative tricarboxylic transport membrane protein
VSGDARAAARIPGALLTLAGVAIGLEATTFDVAFVSDPVGPKALPMLVAVILVGAGLRGLVRPPQAVRWPSRPVALRIVGAAAAFLSYALLLEAIGFFLATTLVVAALSHLYGAPPRQGIPSAAVLAGLLWLLFVRLLALPLPIGDLWMR